MKESHLTAALINSSFAVVIFVGLAVVAFIYAWRHRHDKGHTQILGRRAVVLFGVWLLLTPIAFLTALWMEVPRTPLYISNRHTADQVVHVLNWVTFGMVILAVAGAVLVIRRVTVDADERNALARLKAPRKDPPQT